MKIANVFGSSGFVAIGQRHLLGFAHCRSCQASCPARHTAIARLFKELSQLVLHHRRDGELDQPFRPECIRLLDELLQLG